MPEGNLALTRSGGGDDIVPVSSHVGARFALSWCLEVETLWLINHL